MNSVRPEREEDIEELLRGLKAPVKSISPKYFYDRRGSKLFEQICELPEYYLTRTEVGIMQAHIDEMAAAIGPSANVIEFGSGAGLKTRILLENLVDPVAYFPVDISMTHLQETAESLQDDFPGIEILPVAADFTRPFPLPEPEKTSARNLVFFPGSTIGNFEPDDALELLKVMQTEAGDGGALLIGVDLKKDTQIIENAYNDKKGITAAFNLNVLRHLNHRYGADFNHQAFEHQAAYNPSAGRIEMRLVSKEDQEFSLHGHHIPIAREEAILTEYCHKFTVEQFQSLAAEAGFRHCQSWTDPRDWFSVQLYAC